MTWFVFGFILTNAVLFAVLGIRSVQIRRQVESPYLRSMSLVMAAACFAFVLGALQRLAVQAVRLGLMADIGLESVIVEWQIVQSLAALAIVSAGFWILARTWGTTSVSEPVASVVGGRLPEVDLDECQLTPREREVASLIAEGVLSDRDLAESLFISPSTAATHVKRILAKTGLSSRRDLLLIHLTRGL